MDLFEYAANKTREDRFGDLPESRWAYFFVTRQVGVIDGQPFCFRLCWSFTNPNVSASVRETSDIGRADALELVRTMKW